MELDGVKRQHSKTGMLASIDSNPENAPDKNSDSNSTGEQSEIKLNNIQTGEADASSHEIAEEDMSNTINKIVDIAKEILLITERNLPMDRK